MAFVFTTENQSRRAGLFLPWQFIKLMASGQLPQKKLPLVVCLHGGANETFVGPEVKNIDQAALVMKMHYKPAGRTPSGVVPPGIEDLYFTLYLEGVWRGELGARGSWNSGHMDMDAVIADRNDVDFIDTAILRATTFLQNLYANQTGDTTAEVVDNDRLFMVGIGNGGCMAYRMAVQSQHTFKAMTIVNATIGGRFQELYGVPPLVRHAPAPATPKMGLLVVHGSDNAEFVPLPLVASEVGQTEISPSDLLRVQNQSVPPPDVPHCVRRDFSLVTAVSDWATHNHGGPFSIPPTPTPIPAPGGTNYLYTWNPTNDPAVQLLWVEAQDDRHQWPGGSAADIPSNGNLSGAELAWQFFRHGLVTP